MNAKVKHLMKRFETAFMAKDVEAVMDCLAPRFEWHLPDGTKARGKKAMRAALEARLSAPGGPQFSQSKFRYLGDTVIQTYRVKFKDADGKTRETHGLDVYKISDGLIARKDAYWKRAN